MKKISLLSACVFIIISCSTEQPVPDVDIPLAEHPRPDFERLPWLNLNGYWQFAPDSLNEGLNAYWQDKPESFASRILVPFSWASPMSGIELPKVNVGWYSRTFKTGNSVDWKGKKVYLIFGASDFHTSVWMNGEFVGEHRGGYLPFEFDITPFARKRDNRLVVRVEDEELDTRPSGKQYYGNAKGIWQTVYLEARKDIHISSIRFTPDIDKAEVKADFSISSPASEGMVFRLSGKGNGLAFESGIIAGDSTFRFRIPVSEMRLWSIDDPYLYEVTVSLVNGNETDSVSTYFGMRKISAVTIPGKDFKYVALNNEPLYLRMSLDQSYHPEGFYTFPSDAFMKDEIMRAKNLGLNGLRIHIKAEIPRKLYWADKYGLLIMEDVPNFWGEPTPKSKANWEYIAEQEILRDYNHPSVFSWVLFNETWGLFTRDSVANRRSYTPETREWVRSWYHRAKSMDPTRLVEDNSPCNLDHVITDLNTWHSYNPARQWAGLLDEIVSKTYPGSDYNFIGENVQGDEPMMNSECGAVWGYSGSTGDIDITWEYHIMMNEFRKRLKIAGFLFTEFHDVINEWNGYYRFDRSKKEFGLDELCPGMTMNDLHGDLYLVAGDDFFRRYRGDETIRMPLGISSVTNNIPSGMKIEYTLSGWDRLGEKFTALTGEVPARAEPFDYVKLDPVSLKLPSLGSVMVFSATLKDGSGNVLARNFVPFVVDGIDPPGVKIVSVPASGFAGAEWSIRHLATQKGRKVWGMGSGYFEYEFKWPEGIDTAGIESVEFRAELASRYPQEKYLEEGDAEGIGMTVVTDKGTTPGYGQNSYPQTDANPHTAKAIITTDGKKLTGVTLEDDPADHRGILSWMNQEPGWAWGSRDRSSRWLLDEAGSYGYLVKVPISRNEIRKAAETGKIVIRIQVNEVGSIRGGLSVYGRESGRFQLDPSIIIKPGQ